MFFRIKREVSFPLGVLDKALSDGWLVGGRFTAADLNVASVCTWSLPIFGLARLSSDFPNLAAWLGKCLARKNSPLNHSGKAISTTAFSAEGVRLRLRRNGRTSTLLSHL